MTQPSMADVARFALESEGGVTHLFDNADYASPNACRKAMFKFRNSFYAFKAKARREAVRLSEGRDETSIYDKLSCSADETPRGWSLTISPSVYDPTKFVDANGNAIDWDLVKSARETPEFSEEELEEARPKGFRFEDYAEKGPTPS